MKTHLCQTLLRLLPLISALQVSAGESFPAQAATPRTPETAWTTELHTGALWSIGNNASPLNYRLLPQLITVKTPAHWEFQTGTLVWRVRSRASLELTPVIQGPESYFLGVTFAPSLEWWNEARTVSTFFSAGGGFGWMDAQGQTLPGAQGQDFNLTWFIHTGVSWQITPPIVRHARSPLSAHLQWRPQRHQPRHRRLRAYPGSRLELVIPPSNSIAS